MSYVALNPTAEPQLCPFCKEMILLGEPVSVSVGPSVIHARHFYTIEDRGDRYLLKCIGRPSETYWLNKTPPGGKKASRATEATDKELGIAKSSRNKYQNKKSKQ